MTDLQIVTTIVVTTLVFWVVAGVWWTRRQERKAEDKAKFTRRAPLTNSITTMAAAEKDETRPTSRVSRGRMDPRRTRSSKKV